MKEENCIILDYLPTGYPDRRHAEPVAQALGTSFFSLLELIPRSELDLKQEESVYIGEGKRDKIKFIKGSLEFRDLTNMSQTLLPDVIERIIKDNEKKFVDFFNKSGMITPRMHQFQLLSGVGKKHLVDILDERKKKLFESFEDIRIRIPQFPDPVKIIVERVMEELKDDQKYYLFLLNKIKRERY